MLCAAHIYRVLELLLPVMGAYLISSATIYILIKIKIIIKSHLQ